MDLEQKFAEYEFRTNTSLSLQEIGQAAQHAMEVCKPMGAKLKFVDADEAGFDVQLNNMIGIEFGRWRVAYTADAGQGQVELEILSYSTEQPTALFIPIGPKSSGVLKPFRRFSEDFRAALARTPAAGA